MFVWNRKAHLPGEFKYGIKAKLWPPWFVAMVCTYGRDSGSYVWLQLGKHALRIGAKHPFVGKRIVFGSTF